MLKIIKALTQKAINFIYRNGRSNQDNESYGLQDLVIGMILVLAIMLFSITVLSIW